MRHTTIRVRLTAIYAVLFLLAGAALLLVTYLLVERSLQDRLGLAGNGFMVRIAGERLSDSDPGRQLLRAPDGRTLTLDEVAAELRRDQLRFRDETLDSLVTRGAVALGIVGAVAVASAWLMSERALRPLHQITETARRVADRNLHERIGYTGPRDEIKDLADTFDSMLERLDRAFDGQRRFVANASHELRTPLAINRTLIEVTMNAPGVPAELDQLGRTLLSVNARHERLIDGLLLLAHSEQALVTREPVDLAEVVGHVVGLLGDPTPGQPVVTAELAAATTVGDPVLLERLAHNLVENALAYNVPQGWVSVRTGLAAGAGPGSAGGAVLEVANTGPVLAGYEIMRLFEPFQRLRDRTGSAKGSGLGLSIVASVARAHGGDVSAVPREGGGLIVRVVLPS